MNVKWFVTLRLEKIAHVTIIMLDVLFHRIVYIRPIPRMCNSSYFLQSCSGRSYHAIKPAPRMHRVSRTVFALICFLRKTNTPVTCNRRFCFFSTEICICSVLDTDFLGHLKITFLDLEMYCFSSEEKNHVRRDDLCLVIVFCTFLLLKKACDSRFDCKY